MNGLRIYEAGTRIDDAPALERFLAPIPKPEQVRALLGRQFSTRYYDQESRRDIWIASDGTEIHCVTIADIEVEDAARVRLLCEQRGNVELTHRAVASLVSEALGVTMNVAN